MKCNSWIKTLRHALIFLSLFGSYSHAQTISARDQAMKFAYTTNGAADGSINVYGNNSVSVSNGVLHVQIGDSDGNKNISGVGIYELRLLNKNLEDARGLSELLCSPKVSKAEIPISDLYIAQCDGEMRSSFVRDFSRDVAIKISDLVESLTNAGVQEGRKLVKFDLSLVSIEREKDGFLVTVRFSNSGDYPIKFKTPDKWDARMGKDSLGVSDTKSGMGAKFGLGLAGQSLVEPARFPGGIINLAPHSVVDLKVKTNNVDKFSAGSYDLYAGAFMSMEVIGIESSLLRVDFHSDYKNPTRITFDHDYPSTPEERERWEAMHKADMSWRPAKPGETFAEDGLYRAASMNSNLIRSLQLKAFKAGDVAATEKVTMPTSNGYSLDGPVQWFWEATAPTPVKEWSFDMIPDTVQFSKPGAECPRSGRWVARIAGGTDLLRPEYRHDLATLVTLRRGQQMPSIKDVDNRAEWEWLGV